MPESTSSTPPRPPAPVLLVDDRPANLIALEAILSSPDYELVHAASGAEALRHVERHPFAVVLLDVHMPDMDGLVTAARMGEIAALNGAELPIIFVTGVDSDRARILSAYASGAVDFIQKPIEPDVLRSKVAVFVSLFHARRRLVEKIEEGRRLQQALRAREDLLAVVAHDIRGPLGSVLIAARRIEHHGNGAAPPGAVQSIVRGVHRISRMVDDLLDLARLDAGNPLPIELAVHDMVEIARRAAQELEPVAASSQLSLTCELPEVALARCDEQRVEQVLGNLIGNAIKFTPQGGSIRVAVKPAELEVHLTVRDTGAGIAPEVVPHIFERYRQADANRRRGVGLGLSIVKAIVDAHGGRVWVNTAPGAGSTFHIALPSA
jgi:signal transduction histidine kinase